MIDQLYLDVAFYQYAVVFVYLLVPKEKYLNGLEGGPAPNRRQLCFVLCAVYMTNTCHFIDFY